MNDIKLRAWDKENKFMFYSKDNYPLSQYNLSFSLINENKLSLEILTDIETSSFKQVDADIMQYTGVKDINDVDIYEGDIVDYFNNDLAIIKFINGAFVIDGNNHIDNLNERVAEIKVIGNIYETINK